MDKMLNTVQHKRATKLPKNKKKPVKVVYISNPMKVKTSASEFKALVQELTGQDADMQDPTRFSDAADSVGGGGQEVLPHEMKALEDHHHHVPELQYYPLSEMQTWSSGSDLSFQTYSDDDTVLMPRILENFPGLLSSNSWFESTDADELKGLNAM